MTKTQIESIGIITNQWTSLEGWLMIQLINDGRLYPKTVDSQYYFDTTRSLLYVRYTNGRVFDRKIQDDFVEFTTGKWLQLMPGGIIDTKVGRFHEVFDFDGIITMQ